ncbi:polysaccharide deacetylase family protein [Desulforhopalus sp. IMCC35007]|uniref:polysaccharide deacetylase family protein n=1 Tax=Desulforhopalus sp. IMCC35007 TaxID=2569543 RepID=UPI0010AE7355|nr:polysaccharide deacetylase family protein [Desulforhopalus sp. IMCC35007]TKB07413.1 polysaccharide deacetylase [Desulforhopalus sp. IMCC35007]
MNLKTLIKILACKASLSVGLDRLLRYIYRNKLLVVMYHGVTKNIYTPPVWTQLPEDIFEEQIKWLAENFHPISLEEMIRAVQLQEPLPQNSVLVTFDDGLKNNIDVAYPILQKYQVPATIFLTIDFIGTDRFCWVDELYVAIQTAYDKGESLELPLAEAEDFYANGNSWAAYYVVVEFLKVLPEKSLRGHLSKILSQVTIDRDKYQADFGMMSWEDVRALDSDPLIDFGAHTANHRILTNVPTAALHEELFSSRDRMEKQLGHAITSFCYPNGRLGLDFLEEHMDMLRNGGYTCAFATNRGMFDLSKDNFFAIPRLSVGNDFLSIPSFFKMNASGFVEIRTNKNISFTSKDIN